MSAPLLRFRADEESLFRKISVAAGLLDCPAYVVGGFVRDRILGRDTKDIDIVCLGDGIRLAEETAAMCRPKPEVHFFKNFGTAQIKVRGCEVEFVGARRESYRADSRKPEVSAGSLAEDQARRDFTINALSVSLNEADYGAFLDPFGGMKDLEAGILRTPGDPDITFSDDPLRMMRAVRFAAQLGFSIEEQTFEAIGRNRQRISIVSAERITDEFQKILKSPQPSVGLDLLYRTRLLHEFFPQLAALGITESVDARGHKDNFYHTLQVLDNVCARSGNLWLRWAALLHDIGKPVTKRYDQEAGWTFHGHEVVGERMVAKLFRQMKLPAHEQMRYVSKLVGLHMRPISLSKEDITDAAMRRLLFDAGEDLEDLMVLCESDITSKNRVKVRRFLANFALVKERLRAVEESDRIRNWQPPIDGEEIMARFGLSPSREVGLIKTAIREAILDGIIPNNYEAANALMLEKAAELGLKEREAEKQSGETERERTEETKSQTGSREG